MNENASGGIGFLGVLTIVFIVLKLIGKITWSWFWVLSPLYPGIIIAVVLLVTLLILSIYLKINN
jgi:hypothetical protein